MAGKKKSSAPALPRAALEILERAHALIQRRRFDEALPLLHGVDRQFPNNFTVLQLMGEAAYETRDDRLFLDASDRMAMILPDEPEVMAQRAYAHLRMAFAYLAQRYFQQVVQRWPDSEVAVKCRETLADLEPALAATAEEMQRAGFAAEDVPELATRHEQIQVWLARGKYADARRVAAGLLARWPTFAPALNNVSESWLREGNLAQAIAANRQTLAVMPHNAHALAVLLELLVMSGKLDEAREVAGRLKSQPAQHPDNRLKAAEALALLGDDEAVLRVWAEAEQEGFRLQEIHLAYLHHLAAVAAYRRGDEKRARELWASCLRTLPDFDAATECIADLDRPAGDQTGPWPCPLYVILPQGLSSEIGRRLADLRAVAPDAKACAEARRLLQQQPVLVPLLGLLMRCADPFGCNLAVRLAGTARTPETLALLRDFAFGRHGSDRLRLQAALALGGTPLAKGYEGQMWVEGKLETFRLFDFEITQEPTGPRLPARIEKLMRQADDLLERGEFTQAEAVLRQALGQVPGNPEILYELANLLRTQGRESEAEETLQQIGEKHPDFFFGVLMRARKAIEQGELDEAARLVATAAGRPRLHVTEFVALAITEAVLARARRVPEAAWQWLRLLEAVDPENPNLAQLRAGLR